jgi:ubiquinone/menaquinone biosynthesis C-methylase UbiE
MSEPLIVDHVARIIRELPLPSPVRHLDMGTGPGDMIRRLRAQIPRIESVAVDYHPSHFSVQGVPVAHADLSYGQLPHQDASFDLVTCTEVFEHLESYRHAVREAARVLKPSGWFVVSTPNVLSMKSRCTYFARGFMTYFDPLRLKEDPATYAEQRHITPVPFFYLAHAMIDAGFENIRPCQDKAQRSSVCLAMVFLPILRGFVLWSRRSRTRRLGKHPQIIESLAAQNNSWPVLTGRTLIVTARLAAASPSNVT